MKKIIMDYLSCMHIMVIQIISIYYLINKTNRNINYKMKYKITYSKFQLEVIDVTLAC